MINDRLENEWYGDLTVRIKNLASRNLLCAEEEQMRWQKFTDVH